MMPDISPPEAFEKIKGCFQFDSFADFADSVNHFMQIIRRSFPGMTPAPEMAGGLPSMRLKFNGITLAKDGGIHYGHSYINEGPEHERK
jgi:hypothetical protein